VGAAALASLLAPVRLDDWFFALDSSRTCFADPEKLVSYLRLELIGKAMPVFHHGPL